jgi:L-threonylcarbamoyladenylate synthase
VTRGALSARDAQHLARCLADGGVALLPTDTVYGLACSAESERAVARLYALKERPADRPAAVMFFNVEEALGALPGLPAAERAAAQALLPGAVTLLLSNRDRRFPLACGPDSQTLGLRVPLLPARLSALSMVHGPVMQSSANISGASEARCLEEIPLALRRRVALELDGGELPGVPSTVIDLREYEHQEKWQIVREGALPSSAIERALV